MDRHVQSSARKNFPDSNDEAAPPPRKFDIKKSEVS